MSHTTDGRVFQLVPPSYRDYKGGEITLLRPAGFNSNPDYDQYMVRFKDGTIRTVPVCEIEGFNGELPDVVYWMDRNKQGLYEEGVLYSLEDLKDPDVLKACGDMTIEELTKTLDDGEQVDGYFWGDDSFSLRRVNTYREVYDLLTWAGYDACSTYAASELDAEYPSFVDPKYQLSSKVYEISCGTSFYLANDDYSIMCDKYAGLFGLKGEDLEYTPTKNETVGFYIQNELFPSNELNENFTFEDYIRILKEQEVVPEFAFISINVDGQERYWTFDSVFQLETEWHSENCDLPANDDYVIYFVKDGDADKGISKKTPITFEGLLEKIGIDTGISNSI